MNKPLTPPEPRPVVGSSERPTTVEGWLNEIIWDLRKGLYIKAFEDAQKALEIVEKEDKSCVN